MKKFQIWLHNKIVKIISAFILVSAVRKKFRNLFCYQEKPVEKPVEKPDILIHDNGENNIVEYDKEASYQNYEISINGDNNVIKLEKQTRFENLKESRAKNGKIIITINGNNCSVILSENFFSFYTTRILIGNPAFSKVTNSHIKIGKNSTIEYGSFVIHNSNSGIYIDEDCMLGNNLTFFNTDAHPIYDINTNEIINKVTDIKIGKHCWLANNVKVLKNVSLADNTIVGCDSLVTKSFNEENIIIAGSPAKKVKENVTFAKYDEKYIQNERSL